VVTLEPCDHTGRTGPCSRALVAAGVTRVVFAQHDPNPVARGGAETLRRAGVDVAAGVLADEARAVNRAWSFAVASGRPFVTWKLATTLDGRSAAADRTSRWVSSPPARRDSQLLRASCDAILVGTGTVLADDPRLTARDEDDVDLPREHQLLRAVMGRSAVPAGSRVLDGAAETVLLRTRDPHEALAALFARERRHLLLEGGPTLAAAFLGAHLVDEVVAYVAPTLLGAGLSGVGDLGVTTMRDALHLDLVDVTTIGTGPETNLRLVLTPRKKD
jgi:diaminohydroxyphosphoribosylaminopyrimidine deaminase/5-amino-6-(5-phosphoribosylamino)uracil reductase